MPTILFTGGGSAGHVTPNLALIDICQKNGWKTVYVGSYHGIEKMIIQRIKIPYYPIATGKLRRYFSWRTFLAPFAIGLGILQAFFICCRLKPQVVFSKGGFVAFPVVFAAWLCRIPVIAHESDLTPGLANRLSFPFVKKICVTFENSIAYFKNNNKVIVTGTPLRSLLFNGDKNRGLAFTHLDNKKSILLIYGGGLGATRVNEIVRAALPQLLSQFHVIHLCGKGKTDHRYDQTGYCQFDYVNEELGDLMACADIVISRAGANSIYELLALKKPHILIPLSAKNSRGDQIINATYFEKLKLSVVIREENCTAEKLFSTVLVIEQEKSDIIKQLQNYVLPNSVELIYAQIEKCV